jgi:hypothetical protein
VAAFRGLDETVRPGARLVFVTHSVPDVMEESSGPQGGAYSEQHRQTCAAVAEAAGRTLGAAPAWDLVYCSRSGPPTQAWLEPDVNDHLRALHAQGVPAVVVSPVGFVSDHMEVKFDLDTEAEETARELGLPFRRAATVGTAPDFVAQLVDLALERAETARGGSPARPAIGPWGPATPSARSAAAGTRAASGRRRAGRTGSSPSSPEAVTTVTSSPAEPAARAAGPGPAGGRGAAAARRPARRRRGGGAAGPPPRRRHGPPHQVVAHRRGDGADLAASAASASCWPRSGPTTGCSARRRATRAAAAGSPG